MTISATVGYFSDKVILPIAWYLQSSNREGKMGRLGINRTMDLAKRYNKFRHGRFHAYRRQQYEEHFDELIAECGPPPPSACEMKDGWAIDPSRTVPELEAMIEQAEEIIAERGGEGGHNFGKTFFQDLWDDSDAERFPAFLDFAASPSVIATVSQYLRFIPHIANSQPRGFRLNESWRKHDPDPDGPPKSSQLFHRDIHNNPLVYVIVPIRDVTPESGPFCFFPKSESDRAAVGLRYGERGAPYRVTDERMYSVANREKLRQFCCKAGTILYVDSSECFHYGSRNSVIPRYQLMLAYVSPCRSDFSDILLKQHQYPIYEHDTRLRRMLLDRYAMG